MLHLFTMKCFQFFGRGTCLAADNEQIDGICITIVALPWFVQS